MLSDPVMGQGAYAKIDSRPSVSQVNRGGYQRYANLAPTLYPVGYTLKAKEVAPD